jgi:hypothetical protein
MNASFSRERIDKSKVKQYYYSMNKKGYIATMWPTTPELRQGRFLVRDSENKPYSDCATIEKQDYIKQLAADNPYGFATKEECFHTIMPYVFFPIEEEHYLDEIVAKLRDIELKSYVYDKDEKWNPTCKEPYSHSASSRVLYELISSHPLKDKYGSDYLAQMVRSRKQSVWIEKKRENIRKFLLWYDDKKMKYVGYLTQYIWRSRKNTHTHWVRNIMQKNIVDVMKTLSLTTDNNDLKKYPPRLTDIKVVHKPKKKFDKNSLPSLFQRTWDEYLDNLLDSGREIVDHTAWWLVPKHIKPWYILLRKFDPKNGYERPHQYSYFPYMHKLIRKYYDTNWSLKEEFHNIISSNPSFSEIIALLEKEKQGVNNKDTNTQ